MSSEPDYCGAVVIIHSQGGFLFQRKTPGYPFGPYVGRLALVGGGRSRMLDDGPRDTLMRELREELAPRRLQERAADALTFVAGYDCRLPELRGMHEDGQTTGDTEAGDDFTPTVRNFFFATDVGDGLDDPAVELREGRGELVSGPDQLDERPCWGHEYGLLHWADARGHTFPHLDRAPRLEARLSFTEEPTHYNSSTPNPTDIP